MPQRINSPLSSSALAGDTHYQVEEVSTEVLLDSARQMPVAIGQQAMYAQGRSLSRYFVNQLRVSESSDDAIEGHDGMRQNASSSFNVASEIYHERGGQVPVHLSDKSMTLLEYFPHPDTFPKPLASQQGLDAILDLWDPEDRESAKFESIQYDALLGASDSNLYLGGHGKTTPDGPTVGGLAFSDQLFAISGLFADGQQSIKLSDNMVVLHVVMTAAHENTHANQYSTYPYINLELHKKAIQKLPFEMQAPIFNACMEQMSVFESLAYQAEVINLLRFHSIHRDYLEQNPEELQQWEKLLNMAENHRDIHFARLPKIMRADYLKGDFDAVFARIMRQVPEKIIVRPG